MFFHSYVSFPEGIYIYMNVMIEIYWDRDIMGYNGDIQAIMDLFSGQIYIKHHQTMFLTTDLFFATFSFNQFQEFELKQNQK